MNQIKFPPLTKKCEQCKKLFEKNVNTSLNNWKNSRFCSRKCHNESLKGKPFFDSTGIPSWNKGKKNWMSKEGRDRLAEIGRKKMNSWTQEQRKERYLKTVKTRKEKGNYTGQLGKFKELIYAWKGDEASYSSKHKWIRKHWAKTGICENCGNSPKPFKNGKTGTQWHSKNHDYNREDRTTWLEVCKRCHNKLDKNL